MCDNVVTVQRWDDVEYDYLFEDQTVVRRTAARVVTGTGNVYSRRLSGRWVLQHHPDAITEPRIIFADDPRIVGGVER